MYKRARVVWSEGLHVTPQHFQHLDRYHEEWAFELFRAGVPFGYGLNRLKLSAEAVQNGRIVLEEARGVLPAGVPFAVPDVDELPAEREIEPHFPVDKERIRVHLGLRVARPEEPLFDAVSNGSEIPGRYKLEERELPDETTGRSVRQVQFFRSNLRLLFSDEDLDAYDHIPIAEIERSGGRYALRSEYIPPCLSIEAAHGARRQLRTLHEILVTKARDLRDSRGSSDGTDNVREHWLFGLVNRYIPVLAHYLRATGNHPEKIYLTLAQLAGELKNLTPDDQPVALYDHDEFEVTFSSLVEDIRNKLATGVQRYFEHIKLERKENLILEGEITDDRLLEQRVKYYLGVHADLEPDQLQSAVLGKMKVSSPDRIDDIVKLALGGVELRHVPVMPTAYRGKPGYSYFMLARDDRQWDHVAGSRRVAIYAPSELSAMKAELVAVWG